MSQLSWANQVEYQDRLDLANYQQWLSEKGCQPNYLSPPRTKTRAHPNVSLGRLARGVGKVKYRLIMSSTPMTLIIMKGRSTGLKGSRMQRMTTVVTLAVLAGRTGTPHPRSGLVIRGIVQ